MALPLTHHGCRRKRYAFAVNLMELRPAPPRLKPVPLRQRVCWQDFSRESVECRAAELSVAHSPLPS